MMRLLTVLFLVGGLASGAPQNSQLIPGLPLLPTNLEEGSRFLASGGKLLAALVRSADPAAADDAVHRVGQVLSRLPPLPRIDQDAAANLIENGANFAESNAGNVQNLVSSIFTGLAAGGGSSSGRTGTGSGSSGQTDILGALFGMKASSGK